MFERAPADLVTQMRAVEGFRGLEAIQASEHDVILVILGDSIEVLDQVATEIGSPWMCKTSFLFSRDPGAAYRSKHLVVEPVRRTAYLPIRARHR